MVNLAFYPRLAVLTGSAIFNLIIEDPKLFAQKLLERIRQSKAGSQLPLLRKLSYVPEASSVVSNLFAEGNLRELSALSTEGHSRSDQHKIRRAAERIDLLESPIDATKIVEQKPAELRVLFLLTNSLPHTRSGYTFRSHSILRALSERGVTVSAQTRLAYPVLVGKFPKKNVESVSGIDYARQIPNRYPSTLQRRLDASIEALISRAEEVKANVLHTTTDYNNALVVSAAAKRLGIPWVYEVRGELESTWLSRHPAGKQSELKNSDFYRLARAQETAVMKAANAVVALSEIAKSQLIKRGVPAEKITVIPNAVDNNEIGREFSQDQIRGELCLPNGHIVGTVSSLVPYEGLDDLIRAAALVPELTLLIVGDGSARPELQKLAMELNIADRVIFTGRKDNESIWKWYAALDAFVIPRKDTKVCRTVTPIKGMMAQALGIPVITSDLPALREITGQIATYVPPGDYESLAAAIVRELELPKESVDNIEWAKRHTWQANAQKYQQMYTDLFR